MAYRIDKHLPQHFTPVMTALEKTQQLMAPVVLRENQATHWVTEFRLNFYIFRILKSGPTILQVYKS